MGDQKGELSCPTIITEPNREKKNTFPGKDSANENWLFFYSHSNFLFPLYKRILLPLTCRDLHMAHHRHQTAILYWSAKIPSLINKYLTIYLFQINNIILIRRPSSQSLHVGPIFFNQKNQSEHKQNLHKIHTNSIYIHPTKVNLWGVF